MAVLLVATVEAEDLEAVVTAEAEVLAVAADLVADSVEAQAAELEVEDLEVVATVEAEASADLVAD